MHDKEQLITIKGTRDGLTLVIDDSCSFEEAITELRDKISENNPRKNEPDVTVTVKVGYRYLRKEQKERIKNVINSANNLVIQSFESSVVTRDEALAWKDESEIKVINRIIRSGQVLEITGDLLLIGDVNPGGKVVSSGNIYILGSLRGIAHAGSTGDQHTVIAASYMRPSQLPIAEYISRAPDYESDGVYMECGLIDEGQDKIIIDRLQALSHKRKDLSGFERRMLNG